MLLYRFRAINLSLALILVLMLLRSGVAFADSTTGTVIVNSGMLSLANSKLPALVSKLDDTKKNVTFTLGVTMTDATGSGNGWNVTLTSTTFSSYSDTHKQLPANASSLTEVTLDCASGATCTYPKNGITYPVAIPAAASPPPALKCYNAAVNSGLGTFVVTLAISVSLTEGENLSLYESSFNLSVVSGP